MREMAKKKENADTIIAELREIADNIEKSAKRIDEERRKHDICKVHLRCNRYADMMREAADTRRLADRIEKAVKIERDKRDSAYENAENIIWDYCDLIKAVSKVKQLAIACRAPCLNAKFKTEKERQSTLRRLAEINTTIEFVKPFNGDKKHE